MPGWGQEAQPFGGGGLGQQITELGDPDFAPAASSQGQVPGAAAQQIIFDNQRSAQNLLNDAGVQGFDVSGSQYDKIREQADTGVIDEGLSFVGSLVGWINGPFQAAQMLIQDIATYNPAEGKTDAGWGDYADALFGGLNDPGEFTERTGLDPTSGSHTLDILGWAPEDEDNTFGRVTRGIADFTFSTLTDPISYITFGLSGLGKKAALSASNALSKRVSSKLVTLATSEGSVLGKTALDDLLEAGSKGLTGYERHLAKNTNEILDDFWKAVDGKMEANGGDLPDDVLDALNRWFGDVEALADPAKVLEAAYAHRIGKDVAKPFINRDFGQIHKLALDDLPAYAKGGARIAVPWTKNTLESGLLIPGTQGLGRQMVGDPIRKLTAGLGQKFPKTAWIPEQMRKATSKMDQMAPLLRALRNGDIEGWQWHIASGAIDAMNNNAARHTISTQMNSQWNHITGLAEDANVDIGALGQDIMTRLEGANIDDVLLKQIQRSNPVAEGKFGYEAIAVNEELDGAIAGMVLYMQETMNNMHDALSVLDPSFKDKFITGYMPHSLTKDGKKVFEALGGTATGDGGTGNMAEDLWAWMMNSTGRGGDAETKLGASRNTIERGAGRVQALTFIDDGVIMVDDATLQVVNVGEDVVKGGVVNTDALATRHMSAPQLNQAMGDIAKREAAKHGIPLPPNWDGKLFDENPIKVMIDYVDSMTDAMNGWSIVDNLKASGLAMKHATALDSQGVVQNMFDNLVRYSTENDTVKFGSPVINERGKMPLAWLDDAADTTSVDQAVIDIDSGTYEGLRDSIRTEGFKEDSPILMGVKEDGTMGVMDGHHRIELAKQEGIDEVPVAYIPVGDEVDFNAGTGKIEHMVENWHAEASALYDENIAARGAQLSPQPDRIKWDAWEVMEKTPWSAHIATEQSILKGNAAQGSIPGVSRNVHSRLLDSGFKLDDLADVESVRTLANEARTVHASEWADDVTGGIDDFIGPQIGEKPSRPKVWDVQTDDAGVEVGGFRGETKGKKPPKQERRQPHSVAYEYHPDGGGPGKAGLRIKVDPALTGSEKRTAERVILNWLDRAFRTGGTMDGKLNAQGIQDLIDTGMDSETAGFVHRHIMAKLGALDSETLEFVAKEPAEIFRMRALYDSFEEGINGFIRATAAVRTKDGHLIVDPNNIKLLGDQETHQMLSELKRAALTLGEGGYDVAAKIMQDVEVYTGVSMRDGFTNPGRFNLGGPAIEGLQIQYDVADWLAGISKNMGTIYTPEGIAAAKLAANETLKWWRAMATLPRAAFHIRNLVGGSWMNMNFGVTTGTMAKVNKNGIKFRNALKNMEPGDAFDTAFDVLPAADRNAWREAWENNVLAGFATTEFTDQIDPAAMRKRWDWAKIWDVDNFALTRAGGKVMESVEDFMRMSLFMQYYEDGVAGSARYAADLVNMVHFDYSNLTPTETKLKSLIPFFVWSRRNIPLQISQAVENPRYVQRYIHMMKAMDDNLSGDEGGELPEAQHFSAYAAGTNYRVNPSTPFWARLMIDPDLPINDLLELPDMDPSSMTQYANRLLGPHISTLGDLLSQREFGDVNAPAPFNQVLQGLAAVGMFDKTEEGDVRIPYYMRTLMETAIPFLRETVDPLTGGPTDPNRQQRVGINPEDNFAERSLKTIGSSILGGLGSKFTTPADARSAAYRSDVELDKIIKELRLQGELPLSPLP